MLCQQLPAQSYISSVCGTKRCQAERRNSHWCQAHCRGCLLAAGRARQAGSQFIFKEFVCNQEHVSFETNIEEGWRSNRSWCVLAHCANVDQANWPHIEVEVKRLQVRIAKATREGRWGKVQALQRLLHSGKMLAVKRVTENRGKRTPGVDGKIWSAPSARWNGMMFPRVTARSVRWEFPVCGAGRCRRYGSSLWTLWQRRWRTRILMDSGPNGQLQPPLASGARPDGQAGPAKVASGRIYVSMRELCSRRRREPPGRRALDVSWCRLQFDNLVF